LEISDLVNAEGGLVSAYVVLLDKQQGGSTILAKKQLRLLTALKLSEVADILFRMGWLDNQVFSALSTDLSRYTKKHSKAS
jgi:orotate phosphoribosyltransferase